MVNLYGKQNAQMWSTKHVCICSRMLCNGSYDRQYCKNLFGTHKTINSHLKDFGHCIIIIIDLFRLFIAQVNRTCLFCSLIFFLLFVHFTSVFCCCCVYINCIIDNFFSSLAGKICYGFHRIIHTCIHVFERMLFVHFAKRKFVSTHYIATVERYKFVAENEIEWCVIISDEGQCGQDRTNICNVWFGFAENARQTIIHMCIYEHIPICCTQKTIENSLIHMRPMLIPLCAAWQYEEQFGRRKNVWKEHGRERESHWKGREKCCWCNIYPHRIGVSRPSSP